jgi:hypothetical protein
MELLPSEFALAVIVLGAAALLGIIGIAVTQSSR